MIFLVYDKNTASNGLGLFLHVFTMRTSGVLHSAWWFQAYVFYNILQPHFEMVGKQWQTYFLG